MTATGESRFHVGFRGPWAGIAWALAGCVLLAVVHYSGYTLRAALVGGVAAWVVAFFVWTSRPVLAIGPMSLTDGRGRTHALGEILEWNVSDGVLYLKVLDRDPVVCDLSGLGDGERAAAAALLRERLGDREALVPEGEMFVSRRRRRAWKAVAGVSATLLYVVVDSWHLFADWDPVERLIDWLARLFG